MKQREVLKRAFVIALLLLTFVNICACQKSDDEIISEEGQANQYHITEEDPNEELVMDHRPESSYWFPEELLAWDPKEDADLKYKISTVPLAKRVDKENLIPVNETQNADTRVMAISIMNSSTSGNAPHGSNSADCNIFTFWQYVDELVYWGGSAGEGLIVPPSPDVTDLGHKNGVRILGTVFFPQGVAGGRLEWLDSFLQQKEDGSFPVADKLIEVASVYAFDGWFINQETEGTTEAPLTKDHADKMQSFLKYFKEKAPQLQLVYYDSMISTGKISWQNALTEYNDMFLQDEQGSPVADEMFLNFWWTNGALAVQRLLEKSAGLARESGIDPYSLYAGIDIQASGYGTQIRWDLFASGENSTHTSLGIYCPSWAYASASSLDEFHQKENVIWVNRMQDPSAFIEFSSNTQWRGISTFVIEKSAITELPFITNFNTGSGYSFYKAGKQISSLDWNNRSMGDILPTYRWMIEQEGNDLEASFDVDNAWYGGTSVKVYGKVEEGNASVLHLYSADLPLEKTTSFSTIVKANIETELNAILLFDDGSTETIKGDKTVEEEWTKVLFNLSKFAGKNIRRISYEIRPLESGDVYQLNFGNITITDLEEKKVAQINNLVVDDTEFDEDGMYAGVRLSWDSDLETSDYEIYRVNQDESLSFLGVSNTECFYINALPRTEQTNQTKLRVIPVNQLFKEGEGLSVTIEWPDISLPKAGLKVSQTLIGPGSTVQFVGDCSLNTEEVSWSLPGSSQEMAEGATVSVTYEKAGIYDVTVTAKNASGEVSKTIEGCIVVLEELDKNGELPLLSQGKETEATAYVNENEAPEFAVDGNINKKWCATGTPPHELIIDLEQEVMISRVDIAHAEAGGESADMNTKAYTILVSTDGVTYVPVVSITQNTSANTSDAFAPVSARYVKLSVEKPTQKADTAARIYEIQVYGYEKLLP